MRGRALEAVFLTGKTSFLERPTRARGEFDEAPEAPLRVGILVRALVRRRSLLRTRCGRYLRRFLGGTPKIKPVKLRLVAVGKVREPYVAAACDDFRDRLRRYGAFEEVEIAASHGGDPERAMREEGERLVRALVPGEPCWLLERTGAQWSSVELAERLAETAREGHQRLTLAIAGTYGASREVIARADVRWSLSRLTLLHEWARALVLEQLYRAAKIARDEPYHH